MKEPLLGKTLNELEQIVKELSMPGFTAKQIADWLYKKSISSIDDMQNISLKNRDKLKEKYEAGFSDHTQVQASIDGTKKYLFAANNKKFIEAAYIPEKTRATLCVSSQVGCKMGCLFCMTGKQGFQGNLSAAEILNQIISLPEREKLTNIVYMGMGEPLDNTVEVLRSLEILTAEWGLGMSPRRITVSTIGIIPGMSEFLDKSECHLAISLHTPMDEERKKLMPIQNVYPIKEIMETIKKYDWTKQRRVSMEYIMFKGLNDSEKHIKELTRLLGGIKCRVNLIKFHAIPDTPLLGSEPEVMEYFRDALTARGITSTIRRSRGEDIYAACGMLSTKSLEESKESKEKDF